MRIRRVIAALAAASLLLPVTSVAAQAVTPTSLSVVALGDSYASGTGAGNYYPGTEGACWRSKNSYSELAVQELVSGGAQVTFANVTCSGATIDDLRRTYKNEPPQLNALTSSTRLVFLTIGGNDIGFGTYAGTCLNGNCVGAPTEDVVKRLPGMQQNLRRLLGEIKVRSPHARIVLVGYGRPVTPGRNATNPPPVDPICGSQVLTDGERLSAAGVSSGLDLTLRLTVETANSREVKYVSPFAANSVVLQPSFRQHSLCEAAQPFYRGFDALAPGQEGFDAVLHLNQLGQTTLYQLVRSAVSLAG